MADLQRVIIEMGMGNDLHGMDYTKAAARAIQDALRHSSLPLFSVTDLSPAEMEVRVTVAVQEPDKIDTDALARTLPRGKPTVTATHGGLNVPAGGETIVIAQASVEAYVPRQAGWRLKP